VYAFLFSGERHGSYCISKIFISLSDFSDPTKKRIQNPERKNHVMRT